MQILGPGDTAVMQPWNQVLFPTADYMGPFGADKARSIPGVARALGVIGGMFRQMELEDVKGRRVLPRPAVLENPDPDAEVSWWLGVMVEDYLLHGNAVATVTARDASGWPVALSWVPARYVTIEWDEPGRSKAYRIGGRLVDRADVVHVRRGADPSFPWRGVGVVEQHLATLRRTSDQESVESMLPAVVIEAPYEDLSEPEAEAAALRFEEKYGGPRRKPGVFPKGTKITPLSWSPTDAQLVEARKLAKSDLADIFNLDGYWLGAPAGSFTYRTPGPMYLNLLRQTVEPICRDFEGILSRVLLPHGRRVRMTRESVLRDDLASEVATADRAVRGGLWTWGEARERLGLPADEQDEDQDENGDQDDLETTL